MALLDGTELENKFEDNFFEDNRNQNEVNYEWEKVRKELMADGVKAIKFVFEYYQQHTKLDPWIIASSHLLMKN